MPIERPVPELNCRRHRATGAAAFTLAEVLAALLFMAILIPVTMHGISVASRAGTLGQRKATAMRIAERVIEEQIITGQLATATPYGSVIEGDITYPWTMRMEPWGEDTSLTMNVLTVRVEFQVQGNTYDVAASTLYDPNATTTTTSTGSTTATTASTP
jgi:type II secretory pathway pseudopilin PulG